MNYVEIIQNKFDECKNTEPLVYSQQLTDTISYIKENVISEFLSDNKSKLSDMINKCNNSYTYRTMKRDDIDTRGFLKEFELSHMKNLLEFTDATYEMENDDIVIESVQNKLDVVKKANSKAIKTNITKNSYSNNLSEILDNVYTLLEFCENNSCYTFYENTINDIRNKEFHGTGEYGECQKEYACSVLETCTNVISSGLIQSLKSFENACDICNINELQYLNDKRKPDFMLL